MFSAIMEKDTIEYIIKYHDSGIPLAVLKSIKYPYFTPEEYGKEKKKLLS